MSVVAQCSDLVNGNAMIQTSVIANLATLKILSDLKMCRFWLTVHVYD